MRLLVCLLTVTAGFLFFSGSGDAQKEGPGTDEAPSSIFDQGLLAIMDRVEMPPTLRPDQRERLTGQIRDSIVHAVDTQVSVRVYPKDRPEVIQKIRNDPEKIERMLKTPIVTVKQKGPQEDSQFEVKVDRDSMGAEQVISELGKLIEQVNNPRIAVVLAGQRSSDIVEGEDVSGGIAEATIMNEFKKQSDRFRFYDRNTAGASVDRSKVLAALKDDRAAAALGRLFGVDILILGNVATDFSPVTFAGSRLQSANATISSRMLWSDTGRIIASRAGVGKQGIIGGKASGMQKVVEMAAMDLSQKLIEDVKVAWRKRELEGTPITITLSGIQFGDLKAFESVIQKVSNAHRIYRQDYVSGAVRYEVIAKLKTEDLARKLDGIRFGGKHLTVIGQSSGTIDMRLEQSR